MAYTNIPKFSACYDSFIGLLIRNSFQIIQRMLYFTAYNTAYPDNTAYAVLSGKCF